jgi:hypothetical protein
MALLSEFDFEIKHIKGKENRVVDALSEFDFVPEPQCILDRKETPLRNRTIAQVKVQWKHFGPDEATWEMEDAMK